jgi:SAM-dependent methyltransferase
MTRDLGNRVPPLVDDAVAIHGYGGALVLVRRPESVHTLITIRGGRQFTHSGSLLCLVRHRRSHPACAVQASEGPRIRRVPMNCRMPECVISDMAVQQPGAETDPEAMWSSALARGLIREDALRSVRCCDGYIDVLGSTAPSRRSLAHRAIHNPGVVAVYQRVWRPIMAAVMRLCGVSLSAERDSAVAALHISGEQRVLDVACGAGNFTGFFAGKVSGVGFVIGLDSSVPMIKRAVRDKSCARAVYMRAEELSLPFDDGAFDVVCFAALHLVPEPFGVLQEMVRVLSPGGRIAVMTTYGRESFLVRKGLELGATICGVRVFDRTTVPAFFSAVGLIDIDQHLRGMSQFVVACRPEQVREFAPWRNRSAGWRTRGKSIGH